MGSVGERDGKECRERRRRAALCLCAGIRYCIEQRDHPSVL